MKIIFITLNYSPELIGVGKYSTEMSEWLSSREHTIEVICAPPYYPEWKVRDGWSSLTYTCEVNKNISIKRCPIYVPEKPTGIKRVIHLFSFWLTSLPIILAKTLSKPDLVIVIEPPIFCASSALLLAKLTGAKSILHVQDFEVDAAFELGLLKNDLIRSIVSKVERFLLSKFDCVSTISSKMKSKLNEKGVKKESQYLFPNWVDTNLIVPLTSTSIFFDELKIPPASKVLLYSGNMGNKQGLEIIISAAEMLQSRRDIFIVMCGDGAIKRKLEKLAKNVKNIIWLPFQSLGKLNHLLGLATIHLLPQSLEAADLVMPSKLTGMLSSGRPIIATADLNTQLGEVVSKCGIVVPPGDSVALVSAILKLVDNEELCDKYGKAAREYAEKEIDIEMVMKKFNMKINSLVNEDAF